MFPSMLSTADVPTASTMYNQQQAIDHLINCPPPMVPMSHRQLPVTPNHNGDFDNEPSGDNDESSDDESCSDVDDEPTGVLQQQPALQCPVSYQTNLQQQFVDRPAVALFFQKQQQQNFQPPPPNAQFAFQQQRQSSTTMQNRAIPTAHLPKQQLQPANHVANKEPSATSHPTPRGPLPPPRSRAAYNRYQREFLNAVFERIHYPSRVQREAISRSLGGVVNQNQIKVWFQNARRRAVLRGVKFPPGRVNPTGNNSTPMPPPQNLSGPGSEMVDSYFATIRHFVNQIVELSDNQQSSNNNPPQDGRNRPAAGSKRPRPSEDSDDDEVVTAPPAEKRPAVSTPPRNVVIRSIVEQQNSASSTAASCISPDATVESGFNSFQSSQVGDSRAESSEEERPSSSATSGAQSNQSPTDIRSMMASRASSGVISSLGNYTSPPYNTAPIAGSTPNNNYASQFGGLLDQQFAFAQAMRAAQSAHQSYYSQLMMQQQNPSPTTAALIPQRVHSFANIVQQQNQARSSCAFSSSDNPRNQPVANDFYAPYSNFYSASAPSVSSPYNPYGGIQQSAPSLGYGSYFGQSQPVLNGFVAQLAATLTSSSSSSSSRSPSISQGEQNDPSPVCQQ